MFETSVVQVRAQAARGRFSLLTLSVIAHTAVVAGVVAYGIASVDFPNTAPDAYEKAPFFMPVQIPPPLGTQPRPAQPQTPRPSAQPQRAQVTAPNAIPQTTTPVETPSNATGDPNATSTGDPGQVGDPNGILNSVAVADAPPLVAGPPPVEERIYRPHEVKAPVLLHRVDPGYPQVFIRTGVAATVVVRCVIDKNGQVRSPVVIASGGMRPFDDAVIAAVQQWRYTPASVRGVAVDSYLDVTVRFTVRR